MKASVIIPTRDRAELLDACLRSLVQQDLPPSEFEVIVVDNGSIDSTQDVVGKYSSSLQLRCELAPEPGLHVGRHTGMRLARSDVLVFGDDDIVAYPSWLSTITLAFSDTGVAMVGGNNLPMFDCPPPEWLSHWWETPVGRGRALPSLSVLDFGSGRFELDPGFVWGCNFSIRRNILLASGGFHPDAMPRERIRWRGDGETHVSDWVRDHGFRVLFDSGASVRHRVSASRMSAAYFRQRAFAQGVSDSYSDIRRAGRAKGSTLARLRRRLKNRLHRLRLNVTQSRTAVESELRDIKLDAISAWGEGYDFHQREVRDDPSLFEWVMRENYQ